MDGRANRLIDRKVVGVVFAGMVAMVAVVISPITAGCSVMYCNCSCSCSVVELSKEVPEEKLPCYGFLECQGNS